MIAKKFNAVEMKRSGAEQIYQRTRKMSRAEELAYWARRTEELGIEQKRLFCKGTYKRKAG